MNQGLLSSLAGAALLLVGFGIGRATAPAPTTAPAPAAAVAQIPASAPIDANHAGAPSEEGERLEGQIAEILQVPQYTYLRIQTAGGEEWAAVASDESLKTGQHVAVAASTHMTDFPSKTLQRTFPSIWFGQLASAGPSAHAQASGAPHVWSAHPQGAEGAPQMGAPAAPAAPVGPVEKADGANGIRIAELFAQRTQKQGQTVRVRGSVKRATVVQGKHYLHLGDGTGSAAAKDDDLPVVSSDAAKVGDVITIEGPVFLDKDVGAGVAYPLVLEGAHVVGR